MKKESERMLASQMGETVAWIYGPTLLEGNEVAEDDIALGAESRPVGEDWIPLYAAPAAGMGAEKMADEYSALIGERGYTGGLPREEFIEFLRRHMQQGK